MSHKTNDIFNTHFIHSVIELNGKNKLFYRVQMPKRMCYTQVRNELDYGFLEKKQTKL